MCDIKMSLYVLSLTNEWLGHDTSHPSLAIVGIKSRLWVLSFANRIVWASIMTPYPLDVASFNMYNRPTLDVFIE